MRLRSFLKWMFGALAALEFIIYVLAAIAMVAVGPGIWFYRLISAQQSVSATLVAVFWIISVFFVAREVRRGAITAFSLGIFLSWLIVLFYVFRHWFI
ncbi:MAG: hypothetical protein H0X66_17285 [Verrucomicrobia bacterium]|nr:hypothetical protein [Verrucomicrobiota bacterium]